MMKTKRKNFKQKYSDFHKNHIFLPYIKRREGRRKQKEEGGKDKKKKRARKVLFFPCFQKRRENSEVSANNVINQVSLY